MEGKEKLSPESRQDNGQAALREAEDRYRTLFESIEQGYCVIEVFFDAENRPVDYRFLEVNRAFEAQAGIINAVGRNMRDIAPALEDFWYQIYGQVALTGEPIRAQHSAAALGRLFDVYAFRIDAPEKRHVAVLFSDITGRRRTEKALQASEEKYRAVFEQAAVGIGRVRFSDARWIDVNEAFCKMLGYASEEMLATPWPDITHPDDLDLDLVPFRKMASGELDGYSVEKRFIHKEGRHIWARLTLSLVRDLQGRPDYEVAVIEDISQRKLAEQALRESEERFRNMADNAPVMIWVTDVDGRCTALNRVWYDFTGQSPEEALGFGWLNAVHPDNAASASDIFLRANAGGEPFQIEYRLRRHDGAYRWCIDSATPRIGPGGEFLGFVGSVLDIHDLKLAEKAERERELFYRQMLDSIPGMVFTGMPDGCCDFVSQQWIDFTGVPAQALLGDGWINLLHSEDRSRAFAAWQEAVNDRAPYDLEYRVQRHDGEYEWFKVHGRPIRNEAGQIVRWFGVALNIDQLFRAKEELREAKGAAEEASRAKSEFLANMSHEIRTPMTVFMAAVEHLLQIDRNPERRQLLTMADQSAARLRALIDDILDFSRIEARKVDIEEIPFDLRRCVRESTEIFDLSAHQKNLRLETIVEATVPDKVIGDPDRLAQVLVNLVGNAVKFTREGEIRVGVQVRTGQLVFSVIDTGIGIPEEKRELIFDSFSQADSSFTRSFGGSGLGLAISKGLVELMGGEIRVESREEEGSVFTFTLPLRKADPQSAAAADSSRAKEKFVAARILLAEDEPMIREMITEMLARKGFHVDIAESGRDAVEKWRDGGYDLILMDLQMPQVNGLDATRSIRAAEAEGKKRTCIIGLTAHARREIINECMEVGMDRVLTKPLQISDLYAAIEESLCS